MSDVAIYDDELQALEDQMTSMLRSLDGLSGDQRTERYMKAQDCMKRLNKTFHQFRVEVRMLDGSEQEVYEKKGQAHNSAINSLKEQLQAKRVEADASAAAGSNGGGGYGSAGGAMYSPSSPRNDGKDDARATTQRIGNIQKSTLQSLSNTERLVGETEDIGTDAATKLRGQTEQIQEMNRNLDELDSDVSRAKKELNAFIRRMMTDKIILCFAALILIGIVVIVVLKVIKK